MQNFNQQTEFIAKWISIWTVIIWPKLPSIGSGMKPQHNSRKPNMHENQEGGVGDKIIEERYRQKTLTGLKLLHEEFYQ